MKPEVFLDDPLFSSRIREWLKTLRKKNVAVMLATQSLADIADSQIAPAIIESCPSRIFLPNPRALEPTRTETYRRFGLNETQVRLIGEAFPQTRLLSAVPRRATACSNLASGRSHLRWSVRLRRKISAPLKRSCPAPGLTILPSATRRMRSALGRKPDQHLPKRPAKPGPNLNRWSLSCSKVSAVCSRVQLQGLL